MDLKSAFAPEVPRQPFFRLLLGDPKQSPGGVADFFFPRVRTPCGHGAQVIVEGREEQSDSGEKEPKINPKPTENTAHRPSLHHLVVFPLCWVRQVKRKLMTINGPEFSNEKHGSAGLCSSKVSREALNGLYFMITSDLRPHHSVAKPWSRCRSGGSQCSNASCVHVKMELRQLCCMPWKKPFLVAQPMQWLHLQVQRHVTRR